MIIKNWQDVIASVQYGAGIEWKIVSKVGTPGDAADIACLKSHNYIAKGWLQPGLSYELHKHPEAEEMMYIISGTGEIWSEGIINSLHDGDTIYIAPGENHQLINNGDQILEFVVWSADVA